MHRLGLETKDIDLALQFLHSAPNIKVASIFSHLCGADNPDLDTFTLKQIATFEQMSKIIVDSLGYRPLLHIANSASTIRFKQSHFDMVRLGIGMYGIGCDESSNAHLQRTHRLRTTLNQVKPVKAGESVSYNRSFIATEDTLTGVIPVGYADGFLRKLGNGRFAVLINGVKCPVIGNVCMDMSMINLANSDAKEGSEVIIFDSRYGVEIISSAAETIPYEIFTSISPRVKRVYYYL